MVYVEYIQDACLVAVTATRCGLSRALDSGSEIIPNKLF